MEFTLENRVFEYSIEYIVANPLIIRLLALLMEQKIVFEHYLQLTIFSKADSVQFGPWFL